MISKSIIKMWESYHKSIGAKNIPEPIFDHFCDNEKDANECAKLVDLGIKRATATSLAVIENSSSKMPQVGDVFVVTDWYGEATCVVQTTKVSIIPYNEISEENAYREGEGDKSLGYWRSVHKPFFERELEQFGFLFEETTPIVFEEFEKVFPT